MHNAKLATLLLVMLAWVLGAVPARAETVNCTPVTAPPFVITAQGVYCFTQDWTFNPAGGTAIDIQTNNVVLDLNGFKLGGLAAGLGTTARGIVADNRQNITIKNGTIRGFLQGILLNDFSSAGGSQGHVVEDIRADQNRLVGISVVGSGTIIRNNQVVATGGSTLFGGNGDIIGISVVGSGSAGPRVLNNDVINTVAAGTGTAYGIFFSFVVTDAFTVNNRITRADRGIHYDGVATGKYRDNLTFDVTTPYTGGTNAGNNN